MDCRREVGLDGWREGRKEEMREERREERMGEGTVRMKRRIEGRIKEGRKAVLKRLLTRYPCSKLLLAATDKCVLTGHLLGKNSLSTE